MAGARGGAHIGPALVNVKLHHAARHKPHSSLGIRPQVVCFVVLPGEGPPTREMTREAVSSGFFNSGLRHHPKIQIMTIRALLAGMKPDLPPLGRHEGFRRAPRERGKKAEQTGFNL
jgi:hypothetical protein